MAERRTESPPRIDSFRSSKSFSCSVIVAAPEPDRKAVGNEEYRFRPVRVSRNPEREQGLLKASREESFDGLRMSDLRSW
jgi:hypothetical protein